MGVGARSRLQGAGVVAVVVLGLVAGCSGEERKLPPWPTFSSPTAPLLTPTPKPTPPVKSALAREGTPEGAREFVGWFLQAYTYAYNHNDPTPLRDASTRGCVFCQARIDDIAKQKAAGQRLVGEQITPAGIAVVPGGTTKHTELMGFIDVAPYKVLDAKGKTVQSVGAARLQIDIAVAWDVVAGWRVIDARVTQ